MILDISDVDKDVAKLPTSAAEKPSLLPQDNILPGHSIQTGQVQKVLQEAILLAGGMYAVLLQLAEPDVAKGIADHSSFGQRPMYRFESTITFVYCMSFGTEHEKMVATETLNRAHGCVRGADYFADDPVLQLWVAATLYTTAIHLYEMIYGAMYSHRADIVYEEFRGLSLSPRAPPEMWPPDRKSFLEYWDDQVSMLKVTPEALKSAQDLLYNRLLPFKIRIVFPLMRFITANMLPVQLREAYGFKSSRTRSATYKSLLLATKIVYPLLPKIIRCYPARHYLKRMRHTARKTDQELGKGQQARVAIASCHGRGNREA